MEQQPFATLLMNKVKGNIKINIVDSPGFGPSKRDTLEDLALLTGAKVISEQLGDDMDLMTPDVLGKAKKAVTDKKSTILTVNKDKKLLEDRIKTVENKLKETKDKFWKGLHQKRLAMLSGVVSIIKVGAYTQVEQKEKMDRVEDALHATKAAIEEGIVPGGGTALLYASSGLEVNSTGAAIVKQACSKPFNQILVNAGHDVVKGQIIADGMVNSGNDGWLGFDIKTENTVDMKEAGIIDPTKVTRLALENAASVAGTVLLTECTVVDEPQDEEKKPQIDPSMMGMM